MKYSYDAISATDVLEDVKIRWKNFACRTEMNPNGNRTFHVELNDEIAAKLAARRYPIVASKPKEEGDVSIPLLKMDATFYMNDDGTPSRSNPKIYRVSGGKAVELTDPGAIAKLDNDIIESVDVEFYPRHWTYQRQEGYKARVKRVYVKVIVSPLDQKYGIVDDHTSDDLPYES